MTLPETEYLWSWRLERGYLTETDEEIDELEMYYNEQERNWMEQPWQSKKQMLEYSMLVFKGTLTGGIDDTERLKQIKEFQWFDWDRVFASKKKQDENKIDLEALRASIDFPRLIANYTKINRVSEGKYKALCPFHKEKTASLSVDARKKVFYCFGCSAHGDVFKFVELIEKCTFKEALNIIKQYV